MEADQLLHRLPILICNRCGCSGTPLQLPAAPDAGIEVPRTARMTFALIGGGVVCQGCRSRQHQTVSVRRDVIDEIQRLQLPSTQLPTVISPQVYGELRAVMNRYLQNLLGRQPRMQSFLPTAIPTGLKRMMRRKMQFRQPTLTSQSVIFALTVTTLGFSLGRLPIASRITGRRFASRSFAGQLES